MADNQEIVARFAADTSGIDRAMRGLPGKFEDLKSKLNGIFGGMAAGFGAAFSAEKAIEGLKSISEYVKKIRDVAANSNTSTGFLEGFGASVAERGGTFEDATKGLAKLNSHIGAARNGTAEAIALFDKYEISLRKVNGESKTTDEITKDIADRLKDIVDPSERAGVAIEFFGERFGQKLVRSLQGGREELEKFIAQADKMSSGDIEMIARYTDKVEEMGRQAKVQGATIIGFWAGLGEKMGGVGKFLTELSGITLWDKMMFVARNYKTGDQTPTASKSSRGTNGSLFNSLFTSDKGDLDKLKEADKRDREDAQKHIIEAQKIAHDAAFKHLTIEQKINSLMEDRARLMRVASNPHETDSNRARALAGFARLHLDAIPELRAQMPPQAMDSSGNASTRATARWLSASRDRQSAWDTTHQAGIDNFVGRLHQGADPLVPARQESSSEQLTAIRTQLETLNRLAAGAGIHILPQMGQ